MVFDSLHPKYEETEVKSAQAIDELSGKLKKDDQYEKLMNSVLEGDKKKIDDGKLILESINHGVGAFTPDLIMESLVKNYEVTKKMFGESIVKRLTSYSPNYIDKNIKIPEFQRELRKNVEENIDKLKEEGLVTKEGQITDEGIFLSAIVMYTEELDNLISKGFGEKRKKEKENYGEREDHTNYKKSRYRDLAIRESVKNAIRRGHEEIIKEDIRLFERKSRGKISVIYGLDSSGSMKGEKLSTAKKAGVALAFKAINEKNRVGLIVFGSEIKNFVEPTNDFLRILRSLTTIRASMETNIEKTINKAIDLFPRRKETKHLVLLTDALPTKGSNPEEEALKAASQARDEGITISVIGIKLDDKGHRFAKKVVEIGNGRLYRIKDLKEVDKIILEDYYSLD